MKKKTKNITHVGVIAAAYTALTCAFAFAASGVIQVRVSEALCILPYFTPYAIPGVTLGCLFSNIITGAMTFDVIFGTLATLIGAIGSYLLRKWKWAVPIPPIVANTLIVPQVLKLVYGVPEAVPFLMLTVGIGEIISVGILGMILLFALEKHRKKLFDN
ncbi:MAG: QueT transporter family protein [Ruminococcaceae bacterium]|nr:QueT transporter family protein [Oscillospiraceae bacterium]